MAKKGSFFLNYYFVLQKFRPFAKSYDETASRYNNLLNFHEVLKGEQTYEIQLKFFPFATKISIF